MIVLNKYIKWFCCFFVFRQMILNWKLMIYDLWYHSGLNALLTCWPMMDVYAKAGYIRTGIVQYLNKLLLYLGIILGMTWGF